MSNTSEIKKKLTPSTNICTYDKQEEKGHGNENETNIFLYDIVYNVHYLTLFNEEIKFDRITCKMHSNYKCMFAIARTSVVQL